MDVVRKKMNTLKAKLEQAEKEANEMEDQLEAIKQL